MVELSISRDLVEQIIVTARLFDEKEGDFDAFTESYSTDDNPLLSEGIVEDEATFGQLVRVIRGLTRDEQIDLVALAWIGRGSFGPDEWTQARAEAGAAHNRRTAEYLTSLPMLGDYLEEALSSLETVEEIGEPVENQMHRFQRHAGK